MNKRIKKKRLKRLLQKCRISIDWSNGTDKTVAVWYRECKGGTFRIYKMEVVESEVSITNAKRKEN